MPIMRGEAYLGSDTKRRLDVVAATLSIAAVAPALGLLAAGSAIDTRSRPLFQQERVGRRNSRFNVYKLRTMRALREDGEVQTFGTFDPRASKFGLLLRQAGLDETPQLLNVLKGELSMVGPRPLIETDVEIRAREAADPKLFEDWMCIYQNNKPGLTGKSQLYQHGFKHVMPEHINTGMRLDIAYAEQATLHSDMLLIASTPLRLLSATVRAHVRGVPPIILDDQKLAA